MPDRCEPDAMVPGAFRVTTGSSSQSWVDPSRPDFLAFEYTQQIAGFTEAGLLAELGDERIRAVHVGGGGLSLPRWLAWRRPHTAQIVLEPDGDLVAEVRRKLPLGKHSGIKIREVDGRSGISAMPADYADLIVVDAFAGAQVPAELATTEWFADLRRVLRPGGLVAMNLTDAAPFAWAKRCLAAIAVSFKHRLVGAEPAVFKGRRFGNLVALGSRVALPSRALTRAAAQGDFPYRILVGRELDKFLGGVSPFTDADSAPSVEPVGQHFWYS